MYPNIRLRAGLVAFVFVIIIISLVSAAPIPSSSSQDLITVQAPLVHTTHYATNNPIETEPEGRLVRRESLGAKIRAGFRKMFRGIKHVAQKIGSGIKHVAQKIGSGIKHVAQKIGSGIKKVAQKVGSGIKKVAQKVGAGIKKAAQKVGHFIKTTGAKIVKFGLKVVSTIQAVAGKVAGFIPGVGKIIGKGLEAESKVTGFISNKIHVSLGKKLDKGMNVMNKADKVMKFIPRRRDLSEEESLQQRDLMERDIYERSFDDYLDWE